MSTRFHITLAAVVAVAFSISACKREDKPVSPKPKTNAEDARIRVGSLPAPRPATAAGAGQGIHLTHSPSAI